VKKKILAPGGNITSPLTVESAKSVNYIPVYMAIASEIPTTDDVDVGPIIFGHKHLGNERGGIATNLLEHYRKECFDNSTNKSAYKSELK
jgi:hypothetical protein